MAEWGGVGGKRVVITGATRGIGLAAAEEFARRGAAVTIVARDQARADEAASQIRRAGGEGTVVDVLFADFASLASVRMLADSILRRHAQVHVLVNNAGAMHARRQLSQDGLELTWAVNHLAPFLLTTLLLDRLTASTPARIIVTASDAHKNHLVPFDDVNAERSYRSRGFARYGETKLANILFTAELARRLAGTGVTANCFHPGFVGTGFNRNNGPLMSAVMTIAWPFARSPRKGAETLVWLADSANVSDITGGYFVDKRRATPSKAAQDEEAARALWGLSEQQVKEVPAA